MGSEAASIPKINFSGLVPGTADWDAVEGEVMKALETYGCFEVLYDNVTPELREALFGRAMPGVISLPSEIKKRLNCDTLGVYIDRADFAYESIIIKEDVEEFTKLMWPQGNSFFSDAISAYKKHMKELEQMIIQMIFHSLRIENYYDSYIQSAKYSVLMSTYGVRDNTETNLSMGPHIDPNLVNFICQHQLEGLEVLTGEGEWIRVLPLPNSFTVVTGEALQAWSNGRLQPVTHRVRVFGKEKRYSLIFGSSPKDDYVIKAPEELVDEKHPLVYKPYIYGEFFKFRYSGEANFILKDFCGTNGEEVQA